MEWVSIHISVMEEQSGKLRMKSSGGERAWGRLGRVVEDESEPRNKQIFLAGENLRAEESAYLTALRLLRR